MKIITLAKDQVWEANSLILINKSAGISIHNDGQSLHRLYPGMHFVNRIDQRTSGLVCATRNPAQVEGLQMWLQSPTTQKVYLAITSKPRDHLRFSHDGVLTMSLSDKAEGRQNPQGPKADQKTAVTHYKVLAESEYFFLIQFRIETGRTHQIRRHVALMGIALIGDERYGRPGLNKKIVDTYNYSGMALHSYQLVDSKVQVTYQCPPPGEWAQLKAFPGLEIAMR